MERENNGKRWETVNQSSLDGESDQAPVPLPYLMPLPSSDHFCDNSRILRLMSVSLGTLISGSSRNAGPCPWPHSYCEVHHLDTVEGALRLGCRSDLGYTCLLETDSIFLT
ncbi:hypothetical protein Moror_3792 [Moniliophthora roreri MCA 2997]|uniref:Uncharacterized protein n=1 Tax=Moniliophthora roreri (strain MCA 2997) TaxID=1381753 RepID=V2WBR7_MONRO|nr:hypothetical protein Moror_3792 [Moniliophthora roreri MCA 2997]